MKQENVCSTCLQVKQFEMALDRRRDSGICLTMDPRVGETETVSSPAVDQRKANDRFTNVNNNRAPSASHKIKDRGQEDQGRQMIASGKRLNLENSEPLDSMTSSEYYTGTGSGRFVRLC